VTAVPLLLICKRKYLKISLQPLVSLHKVSSYMLIINADVCKNVLSFVGFTLNSVLIMSCLLLGKSGADWRAQPDLWEVWVSGSCVFRTGKGVRRK